MQPLARRAQQNKWHLHHQGGPAGYEPCEYVAMPRSTDVVLVGQVYAWNPSITGTKVDGQEIARPAILEIL